MQVVSLLSILLLGVSCIFTSPLFYDEGDLFMNDDVPMNNRPIIAILAQDDAPGSSRSYIAASYVKFIEASGARVVPIPAHLPQEEVEIIFDSVNGVLFPGGGTDLSSSGYYTHAKFIFNKAVEANQKGDYFPIWGTCLGFEALHVIAAGDKPGVISSFSASDISLPLVLTNKSDTSRLLGGLPASLKWSLTNENITYNHHSYGISPLTYLKEKSLKTFFKVLSTNKGKAEKTFISTVEGLLFFAHFKLRKVFVLGKHGSPEGTFKNSSNKK